MPAIWLYTIIIEEPLLAGRQPRVTFELSKDMLDKALAEKKAKEAARLDNYELSSVKKKPFIYVGENEYTIYNQGPSHPLPSNSMSLTPENLARNKPALLNTFLGPVEHFFPYIDAYQAAYIPASSYIQFISGTRYDPKNIFIKGPDGTLMDNALNPLTTPSPPYTEAYRYKVTEENDGLTLTMEVNRASDFAQTGLRMLKRYASHLVASLNIKDQNKAPKINITGSHAKKLYHKDPNRFTEAYIVTVAGIAGMVMASFFVWAGIMVIASNPVGWLLLGIGALGLIGSLVTTGYAVHDMIKEPYKDLLWHQNDLASMYEAHFKTLKADIKPEVVAPIALTDTSSPLPIQNRDNTFSDLRPKNKP